MATDPLILVTNDDGVQSPGLLALIRALWGLGEIVVVAPEEQQSSSGRAFYWKEKETVKSKLLVDDHVVTSYAVSSSPAVAMRYALLIAAKRPPALVVSGINYGENMGSGLTVSGTVGAALEAAADGIPSLAVSLEMEKKYHTSYSTEVDFATAGVFARRIARWILEGHSPPNVPLLNVNVPSDATRDTPWRVTRASHQAYFQSMVDEGRFVGYDIGVNLETLEPDSDIHAVFVDRVVSVTPLTYDLTVCGGVAELKKVLPNAKD